MGEFDKNQPVVKPADARRKQVLMGALGAVLLAVLAFHFLKGNPENADAGPNPANPAEPDPAAARSPSDELHDLLNDPTAKLLQTTSAVISAQNSAPQDPFRMPARFLQPAPVVKSADPTPVDPHPVQAVVPTIPADSLKVEGIFRVSTKLQAIVNGNIVTAGMTVDDALIVDIKIDRIVVRHKDYPDGPTTTVLMRPAIRTTRPDPDQPVPAEDRPLPKKRRSAPQD